MTAVMNLDNFSDISFDMAFVYILDSAFMGGSTPTTAFDGAT